MIPTSDPRPHDVDLTDARFMDAALALGRRNLGRTAPNPSVGAILVQNGLIVGRGCTAPGGRPHAEAIAIEQAGEAARGATLYVTLEPCSHQGRTGPCCEAVVAAGIARVVCALVDPNPLVAGQGLEYVRGHGIEVSEGVGAARAARDHRGHVAVMTKHRPMVTLKLAETADGFVAGGAYDPRLSITGVAANGAVHVMRAMHDAIMVGIGTILADDPLMTVRLPCVIAKPLRIVLDRDARIPLRSRLLETARDIPVLVVIGAGAPIERVEAIEALDGVACLVAALGKDGRLDLAFVLAKLAERGITRVFSEGGPTIAGALIAADLVDDIYIFTAPRPLGDDGVATLSFAAREALADPARFRPGETTWMGPDRLSYWESLR